MDLAYWHANLLGDIIVTEHPYRGAPSTLDLRYLPVTYWIIFNAPSYEVAIAQLEETKLYIAQFTTYEALEEPSDSLES